MDYISQYPWMLTALEIAVKSLIITSFAFLLLFFLRNQAASLRHQICAISLLSLPLLLISPWLIPVIPIPILPAQSTPKTAPSFATDQPLFHESPAMQEPIRPVQQNIHIQPLVQTQNIQEEPQQEIQKSIMHTHLWPLLLWLFGTSFLLLRFLLDIRRRNHLTRQSIPICNTTWTNHITHASDHLKLSRPIKILQSPDIQIPLTYGWQKPVILLPHEADNWSSEQQRVVILHELAHIKRKDQFIQSLCHISNALFWFNPLVWIIKCRLQTEQERACDDYVINSGITASDYATQLLNIARTLNPTPQMATVPFARKADLPDRIRLILNNHINRKPTPIFTSLFATLLLIVPTFAIAPLHTAQQSTSEEPPNTNRITQRDTHTDTMRFWQPHALYGDFISFNNNQASKTIRFYRTTQETSSTTKKTTGIHLSKLYNTNGYIVNLPHTTHYMNSEHIVTKYHKTPDSWELFLPPVQHPLAPRKKTITKTHQQSKQDTHQNSENTWVKQDTVQSQSSTEYSPIAKAVINGDLKEVRALLKQGEDPNQFIGDNTLLFLAMQNGIDLDRVTGNTSLLLLAIQNGYNIIAEELITHGARVNYVNPYGLTPLLAASQQGNLTIVDKLLTKGAYTHAKTQTGETAFYFAVAGEHIEVAKRLLKQGVDANQSFGSSYHPLYTAIQKGNKELVELLLQHGANPLMTLRGFTPAQWASLHKQNDILDLLIQKARQDSFQGFIAADLPPLLKATNNGELREVRRLLAEGADPNQVEGGLPILAALRSGYHVIVKELLDHGADINLQNTHDGETVLMWAARKGDIDLFKQVMEKKPDVNARSKNGASALLFAPQGKNPEIVKILLDHNAEVNIKGHNGVTPLLVAAQNGNSEIVKILIEHGADVHAKTDFGESSLESAITSKHIEVVRQLLSAGINVTEPLKTGWYPLHVAATAGNKELVELLLAHGADPNTPIGIIKPLHSAISHGHNDVAGLLMQKTEKKQGTIYGLLTDSKTGQPIQGGVVVIKEIGRIATIGKGGMYYLSDIPTGSYTLRAMSPGYETKGTTGFTTIREGFTSTYHMRLKPDLKDETPLGLGSLIYRYASNKGRANVVVKYTSPKMRNLAHSANHINKIDQSTRQTLFDWPASEFENNLASARENIKKELNTFLKDPDTGKEGVVDVYIGDYYLRN